MRMVPTGSAFCATDFLSPLAKGEFELLIEKIITTFEKDTASLGATQSRAVCLEFEEHHVLASARAVCPVLLGDWFPVCPVLLRHRADKEKLEVFRLVVCLWSRSMEEVLTKEPVNPKPETDKP